MLVPIGGGGLISGVATAIKGLDASIEVIGVEVEASCAFSAARAAGRIVDISVGETIADGLGGNVDPETITWPVIRDLVDRIIVVPEGAVRQGVCRLVAEDHLVAEGAGCGGGRGGSGPGWNRRAPSGRAPDRGQHRRGATGAPAAVAASAVTIWRARSRHGASADPGIAGPRRRVTSSGVLTAEAPRGSAGCEWGGTAGP